LLKLFEERNRKIIFTALKIYWILLFIATSYPSSSLPTFGVGDKVEHMTAFFILGVLLNLTLLFQSKYPRLKEKHSLYTILLGSGYAIFDEVHQIFIPGRFCEFLDFAADFTGLVLAVVFIILLLKVNKFIPE
jgi:VanZ family protein